MNHVYWKDISNKYNLHLKTVKKTELQRLAEMSN